MIELAYFNGSLVPRTEAKVSVMDYGFLFGYGLYETIRAYEGKLFRLDAHLARLQGSANQIGIPLRIERLRQGVLDVVRANGYSETRVRITVSIGEGTMTPNLASCTKPTVLVLAGEYHPFERERYERGFNVIVSSVRKNSRSPVTYMKSASSMENMIARQEARKSGADESLFLNEHGHVTEASGSNLFLVEDGVVKTPRLENGILPGVTRAAIFQLGARTGFEIVEEDIRLRRLLATDEVFLSNSLIEIMPVTTVGGTPIGEGAVGPATKAFMKAYRELVLSELRAL